jgi:hypothetical protein
MTRSIPVFVLQPHTRADLRQQLIVQAVLDLLPRCGPVEILTGRTARSAASFRAAFEHETGEPFSPGAFRRHRLALLDRAEVMVVLRTGPSESGAFELARNVFGRRIPVFMAVHDSAPLATTLLQELDELCPVRYAAFDQAEELLEPLSDFLAVHAPGTTAVPSR